MTKLDIFLACTIFGVLFCGLAIVGFIYSALGLDKILKDSEGEK